MTGERAWQRLWHGKSEDLVHKIPDGKVDAIITDPPFGVDNLSNRSVTREGKAEARKIANDESPEVAIATFQRVMSALLPKMKPESDIYVFTSYQVLKEWMFMTDELFALWEYQRKAIIIWEKNRPGMGDTECPWGMGMEFILFFRRGRRLKEVKRRTAVIHVPAIDPGKLIHPHEKPTQLLEMFIKASADEGTGFVVDPFGGSMSVPRAARLCNRNALGIEYDLNNFQKGKHAYDTQGDDLFA